MAKYDETLSRMIFLMEDNKPQKAVESSVKYHANGADGKVYGCQFHPEKSGEVGMRILRAFCEEGGAA